MSNIKKTLTLAIMATSLLGAGSAMAWGGMHKGGGAGFCGNMQNLNLTQAQKAQLNDMRQHHQGNNADMTNWQQQQQKMQTLIQQKNFDESKARELINEQQKVRTDRQVQFLKDRHTFYQSLTEAQKKTFNDNCAKGMNRSKNAKGDKGDRGSMGSGW